MASIAVKTGGDDVVHVSTSPSKRLKTVFSGFWDEGVLAEDGNIDYSGLNLTIGEDVYEVRVGDSVRLRGDDPSPKTFPASGAKKKLDTSQTQKSESAYSVDAEKEEEQNYYGQDPSDAPITEAKVGDGVMLARVERIWQENGSSGRAGRILFEARWFLKVQYAFSPCRCVLSSNGALIVNQSLQLPGWLPHNVERRLRFPTLWRHQWTIVCGRVQEQNH
jgi:hypothetical protein